MTYVTAINQVFRCSVCGNIFEVLHVGGGEPVCCGKPTILLEEKNSDIGKEKHAPIITPRAGAYIPIFDDNNSIPTIIPKL